MEALKLAEEIGAAAQQSNYGIKRIYEFLKNYKNYRGNYSTIYKLCKEKNLMIYCKRRALTKADSEAQKTENLIKQDFTAQTPNEKWLMDITEIP